MPAATPCPARAASCAGTSERDPNFGTPAHRRSLVRDLTQEFPDFPIPTLKEIIREVDSV
jgi:hypothetical protein